MTSTQTAYRRLLVRATVPVSLLVAALLAVFLASLFAVADYQTRIAQGVEGRLALDALRARADAMERSAIDYATWDDLVAGARPGGSGDWLDENIGRGTLRTFDLDKAFVVAPDGSTLYASDRGRPETRRADAVIGAGFQMLLDRARASPAGVALSELVSVEGTAALASAAPLRPLNSLTFGGVPPVLVFVKRIDASFLFAASRTFLLPRLRLAPADSTSGYDRVALFAGDGSRLGDLEWNGARPGEALLRVALPVWAVLAAGFVGLMLIVLRQAASATRLLEDSERRARHDALTGLPNRVLLFERLDATAEALAADRSSFAVVYIDLDGFKAVNDTFGHEAGDAVLRETAARIRAALREGETAARLGGDEFVLLLPGISKAEDMERRGRALIRALEEPVEIGGGGVARVSATLGAVFAPQGGTDPLLLLRAADNALCLGKRRGKGRVVLHEAPPALRRAG